MGELGFVWTPHQRRVTRWKQIHHQWIGAMCNQTTSNRGLNSPPSTHRVGKLCGITWNRNTISFFSTRCFIDAYFGLGLLRDQGGSSQSRITESKICGQTPIIYVLRPSTTTMPTHMCKLVDTFYNIQFVVQAWSSSLKLYVALAKWFWPTILAKFVKVIKLCTSEKKM